mgnify:CR=1 FL=1
MPTTVAMTEYSARKTLHFWLNGGGTAVTQAAARPYVYLFTGTPTTDTGTSYTALSGGITYTPQLLPAFTVGASASGTDHQRAFNTVAVTMTMGGSGSSVCNGILICLNNSAIPALTGNNDFSFAATVNPVLYYGTLNSSITLNVGDTLTFSIGDNTGTVGITVDQY